ncbi:hypothetical protein ACFQE0_14735 [Methylobacterium komagatae]|uniref:Uncharacterized protein n=1 Tax=Methylobacterium komagatae TaxID=374425 RepID=A0ABW2BL70_9HYPH
MPEPIPSNTMDTMLSRPLDVLGVTNVEQPRPSRCAPPSVPPRLPGWRGRPCWPSSTPAETHAALRERPATYHHELHSMVMERAYRAMPIEDTRELLCEIEQERADASMMVMLCEAFRANPTLFVPGARPAKHVAFYSRTHDLDGWIELADGRVLPWLYAPGGVGQSAIAKASRYVEGTPGVDRALVVGTHVRPGFLLPDELTFVCLAVDTAAPVTPGPKVA